MAQVIKVGETVDLVQLSLREEVANSRHYWPITDEDGGGGSPGTGWGGGRSLKTHLTLLTNLTSVKIPLLVFDGKLKPVRLND